MGLCGCFRAKGSHPRAWMCPSRVQVDVVWVSVQVTMTVCNLKLFSDNHQIILINTIENSQCLKRLRLPWSPRLLCCNHLHQIRHCDSPPTPQLLFFWYISFPCSFSTNWHFIIYPLHLEAGPLPSIAFPPSSSDLEDS